MEFRTDKNILYINLEGKIDASNAPEFEEKINEMRGKILKHRDEWEEQTHPWGVDFWERF